MAFATEDWHCQGFLAFSAPKPPRIGTARDIWRLPPRIGTARDFWRFRPRSRPALALSGIFGARDPPRLGGSADSPSQGSGMLYALENERPIGVLSWTSSKLSPTSWAFRRAMSRRQSTSSTAVAPCPSSRAIARKRRATWAMSHCASWKSGFRTCAGLPHARKRCKTQSRSRESLRPSCRKASKLQKRCSAWKTCTSRSRRSEQRALPRRAMRGSSRWQI